MSCIPRLVLHQTQEEDVGIEPAELSRIREMLCGKDDRTVKSLRRHAALVVVVTEGGGTFRFGVRPRHDRCTESVLEGIQIWAHRMRPKAVGVARRRRGARGLEKVDVVLRSMASGEVRHEQYLIGRAANGEEGVYPVDPDDPESNAASMQVVSAQKRAREK